MADGLTVEEMWEPVARFEDFYEVSNQGRVRRLAGWWGGGFHPTRILRPGTTRLGRKFVILYRNSRRFSMLVHRIVLTAFVGPCPTGLECRHLDGNPSNNRVTNLAWGTHAENMKDSVRHGTNGLRHLRGEKNPHARLTEGEVATIKKLLRLGWSTRRLAERYKVSRASVWRIAKGLTWRSMMPAG